MVGQQSGGVFMTLAQINRERERERTEISAVPHEFRIPAVIVHEESEREIVSAIVSQCCKFN